MRYKEIERRKEKDGRERGGEVESDAGRIHFLYRSQKAPYSAMLSQTAR